MTIGKTINGGNIIASDKTTTGRATKAKATNGTVDACTAWATNRRVSSCKRQQIGVRRICLSRRALKDGSRGAQARGFRAFTWAFEI